MKSIFSVLAISLPLAAQWLHQPTVGIPRTADGKPNLKAPAPRTADNKPDLSGLWQKRPGKYGNDVAADLKPGDVQPWAETLYQKHKEDLGKDSMSMLCLPWGPRFSTSFLSKIVQTPGLILILQDDLSYRQIFMDGRELPKDPNPTFMGYSVGRWEGDTLVVGSIGFNDRTWLDGGGHPHTEALHLTERFRRTDFGHMEVQLTIDDPRAYAKAWTVTIPMELEPDSEILEYICQENEKDRVHLVGKASDDGTAASPQMLAGFAGVYEVREGGRVREIRITQTGNSLLVESEGIGRIALNPLSRTAFAGAPGGRLEFVPNADGTVTRFTWDQPGGIVQGIRTK